MIPRISIVVAVLNARADLESTLDSISSQEVTGPDRFEVVIIDGASTDGTLEVAQRFPAAIISEPDSGIYDAMNKGAALATGEWLHFLNAGDTFSTQRSLETVLHDLDRADRAKRTWFISGAQYAGGRLDGVLIPNLPHHWYRHALGLQPHCHQATWFRTDLFRALGGYTMDAGFASDFDLILRWGATGAPETDTTVLVNYLSGGLSDQRGAEVPELIRHIRRRRLQLDGIGVALDRLVRPVARVSIKAGRIPGKLRRIRRKHMAARGALPL